MTPAESPDGRKVTSAEFHEKLSDLVEAAEDGGVDLTGGWDVETASGSEYSVEIFRIVSD